MSDVITVSPGGSLPTIEAEVIPCGGIVKLTYTNPPTNPPVGPWTITRTASGSPLPPTMIYQGQPVVLTIDPGIGQSVPLSGSTLYTYTLTDPSGSESISIQPAASVTIETDDITTLLIRMLQAGIGGLTLPEPGWVRPNVIHAMPLTGQPRLPIITLADALMQQQFAPIGENVNTDATDNEYYINDLAMRHFRVTILTMSVIERQFYRDAVIGLFKSVMGPMLESIGQNVSHRYQAASSQVVGEQNNPGFYFCDLNLEITGLFNVLVKTNYGVLAVIDSTVYAELSEDGQPVPTPNPPYPPVPPPDPISNLQAEILGAVPYIATLTSGLITEDFNGQPIATTIAPGLITVVYGAPLNQTWQTTISNGTVTTVRIA